MRDPHVVSLHYRLQTRESVQFKNPPPAEGESGHFRYRLADGRLSVELIEHHPDEASARMRVDPFLRAWELDFNLRHGVGGMWFEFDRSEVIDRGPPQSGEPTVLTAVFKSVCSAWAVFQSSASHSQYPPPPTGLAWTATVDQMWHRYQQFEAGREPLLSMAYFCLSALEGTTGQPRGARTAVCSMYSIDQAVRDELGDLVSDRGSPTEARKLGHSATHDPLTETEREWVKQVVRALIRRKAEYDADPTRPLPRITLGDFPQL